MKKRMTRKQILEMYQGEHKDLSIRETLRRIRIMLSLIWKESHGIVVLKFVCILFETAALLVETLYLKWIIDALTGGADLPRIVQTIVVIHLLLLAVAVPNRILSGRVYPVMQQRVQGALKAKLMESTMKRNLGDFEDRRFFEDTVITFSSMDSTAFLFLDKVGDVFSVLLSVTSLIAVFAVIDAYVLLFVAAILIVRTIHTQRRKIYSHLSNLEQQKISMTTDYFQRISNAPDFAAEVRSYTMSAFILKKFREAYRKMTDMHAFFLGREQKCDQICDAIVSYVISPALLVYLAYRVISGDLGIGSFSVVFTATFSLNSRAFMLINAWGTMKFNCAWAVERYLRALQATEVCIETQDSPDKLRLNGEPIQKIEFRDVVFHYPRHESIVLDQMSFTITKGKKIAIVGRNGVGKTTLVKLLQRLYDVSSGEIRINDHDIRDYNVTDLRHTFSMMLQEFRTYQMTVAENVKLDEYSGEDEERERLFEALRFANLDEKVEKMKRRENSMVGRLFDDEGEALSGGEKQRLAIARGYLRARGAEVFILDEPNSALDPIAEYELNKKIMEVLKDQTVIMITHRLSTTVFADEILYVENGRITERGTHDELMNLNGKYADMFNKQAEAYQHELKAKSLAEDV